MAGLIPQSFIDELVSRADIVEVIDARVPLKKAGREFQACCPFHDEKTPSFTVSPQKQFFHCFGCGAHGTVLGFLMDYEHLDFVEAIEDLAQRYGLEVPREGAAEAPDDATRARSNDTLDVLDEANTLFKRWLREHPRSQSAKDYLKDRGMSGKTAAAFEIGYAPPGWDNLLGALGQDRESQERLAVAGLLSEGEDGKRRYDRFRDRIMFPIHGRRGRVVGFGARTLGDETPKYLNSPETPVFHKGRELYGLNRVQRLRERPPAVVVVEGYMDVVMLAEHGIEYACAALGTAATPEQMERLFRVSPHAVFCFDGDNAGRRAAWRALENALPYMRDDRSARFMFLPQGEDPDSFVQNHGAQAFESLMADAPTLTAFLFKNLRERIDTTSLEGRARLQSEAMALIEQFPEGNLRTLAIEELSRIVGVDASRMERNMAANQPAQHQSIQRATPPHNPMSVTTPVRRALKSLLHDPGLAKAAGDVRDLTLLEIKGAGFLAEVIEMLQKQPDLSTAGVLEHFRGHPAHPALIELATLEALSVGGDGAELEFQDCLAAVRREAAEVRYQTLRVRVEERSATESEKKEYLLLVQARAGRPA